MCTSRCLMQAAKCCLNTFCAYRDRSSKTLLLFRWYMHFYEALCTTVGTLWHRLVIELQAVCHEGRCCGLFNRNLNISNVVKYKVNILLWLLNVSRSSSLSCGREVCCQWNHFNEFLVMVDLFLISEAI